MNGKRLRSVLMWGCALLGACGGSASRDGKENEAGDAGADSPAGGSATAGTAADGGTSRGGSGVPNGGRGGVSGDAAGGEPAEAGGSGAAGASSSLPLPAGCEARGRMETETSCSLAAYCRVQSQLTECDRLPSGRWQCRCDQEPEARVYELEGAPGMEACAVTTGLCTVDVSTLGDESCDSEESGVSADACRVDRACRREIPVDFAPQARAWLVRHGAVQCARIAEAPAFECQYASGADQRGYDLFVDSGAVACAPLIEFAMSGAEPEWGEKERCAPEEATSSDDGCERHDRCSQSMPLANGVDLALLQDRYANCVPGTDAGSDCYCSTDSSSFDFRLSEPPVATTCASIVSYCAEDAEISATGEASCEPDSQDAGDDWCDADLSCRQAATVNGQDVVAKGRLLVTCNRTEAGLPWRCSCASDQTTAKFRLDSAALSASEACQEAPRACRELIDVHLGPYGSFLAPPSPLLP